ncbi:MAG: hypothetical protein AAB706_02435 [Patescibacteria group bacterium]
MNEKHVTSLALSKRLKELGCKQESEYYIHFDKFQNCCVIRPLYQAIVPAPIVIPKNWYSTFLASELGEMLPMGYVTWHKTLTEWYCAESVYDDEPNSQQRNTMPEAMGQMLAYLIEHDLLKV